LEGTAHLSGGVHNIVLVEDSNGGALSGHVGALSHQLHSRLDQRFSVVLTNLVLGSTGQGNVVLGLCAPWLLALNILACQEQLESVISISSITMGRVNLQT
jgi:hypothetical protein